jgi:hypothetical protein
MYPRHHLKVVRVNQFRKGLGEEFFFGVSNESFSTGIEKLQDAVPNYAYGFASTLDDQSIFRLGFLQPSDSAS